ncbi:MAG: hypothetical protein ACRC35_01720 [Angustibacter sp.]
MSAVVIRNDLLVLAMALLAAGVLLALARGLLGGRSWVRSPALVWHALLVLAVGGGLWQSGRQLAGAAVAVAAIATAALCVLATPTGSGQQ